MKKKKSTEFTMELNVGDVDFRETILMQMRIKKVSIYKLARDANLNYGTVHRFLNGKSQMGSSNLCKLFNIINKI